MEQLSTVPMTQAGPAEAKRGFWQKRLRDPLVGFLAQGFTPVELSRAIAVAVVCGLFPFLGATTLLTLGAGLLLRLNQPVMQTVNYLLSPAQLVLIPVFVQIGAWLLGADAAGFSLEAMLAAAREGSVREFLMQFGRAGWYALVAWLVAAPGVLIAVFLIVSPVLKRWAGKRTQPEGKS